MRRRLLTGVLVAIVIALGVLPQFFINCGWDPICWWIIHG